MSLRILLVEDEIDFRQGLCDILNLEGFSADGVGSIGSYQAWCMTHQFDVLVIDRQLPDGDGLDILRTHRRVDKLTPIIVLTAKGLLDDRIAGIHADANHYLVKPVAISELLAIFQQIARRHPSTTQQETRWLINPVAWYLLSPNGEKVVLTRSEVVFLSHFIEQPGISISKRDIIVQLGHDPAQYDHRRLEVMVRRLRNKIEEITRGICPINTIYGVGYAFNGFLSKT